MLNKLMKDGKSLILAYDQGLEHGPTDFNEDNVNPAYVINIANHGKFNAFACHKGIAEKYRDKIKVPLIVKLNGKTSISKGEPISSRVCSVPYAVKLKASAVGYTLYIGSERENEIFKEFGEVQEEARKYKLPVVTWIYPRGKAVKDDGKYMAYAARIGLELGADIIKIKYNGNIKDLEEAVDNSGMAKIVISGGSKKADEAFLKQVKDVMKTGVAGMAIGRNIWQNERPLQITKKIQEIMW
jgi:fructose-bisphosphate aldolase, class I